jgi:hypothetical protein
MKPKSSLLIALVILALLTGGLPALASSTAAVPQLPWDIQYAVDDINTTGISVETDAFTGLPMVVFYNRDTNLLTQSVYHGPGYPGDCGTNNVWTCFEFWDSDNAGKINDVAYFANPSAAYRKTGYFFYDESEHSLEYWLRYDVNDIGNLVRTKIIDLDNYCGTSDCAITSAVSLAYDDYGYAHAVAVIDTAGNDDLIYFHEVGGAGNCVLYGGSELWEFANVVTEDNGAADPSITMLPPNSPRIAYYRPADSSLRYAYPASSNANCGSANDWRCIEIDDTGSTGRYPSIAYGGALHIAYFNAQTGYLWLAKYVGNGGNCGFDLTANRWQCDAIDNVGITPLLHGISLVMDDTEPVIAYMDANDSTLSTRVKLAQRVQRAGLTSGNCGPGDIFQTWYCQTLDQGPYDLGGEIDMVISARGALFVGYLEDNYDMMETHVYAARQYYQMRLPMIRK